VRDLFVDVDSGFDPDSGLDETMGQPAGAAEQVHGLLTVAASILKNLIATQQYICADSTPSSELHGES